MVNIINGLIRLGLLLGSIRFGHGFSCAMTPGDEIVVLSDLRDAPYDKQLTKIGGVGSGDGWGNGPPPGAAYPVRSYKEFGQLLIQGALTPFTVRKKGDMSYVLGGIGQAKGPRILRMSFNASSLVGLRGGAGYLASADHPGVNLVKEAPEGGFEGNMVTPKSMEPNCNLLKTPAKKGKIYLACYTIYYTLDQTPVTYRSEIYAYDVQEGTFEYIKVSEKDYRMLASFMYDERIYLLMGNQSTVFDGLIMQFDTRDHTVYELHGPQPKLNGFNGLINRSLLIKDRFVVQLNNPDPTGNQSYDDRLFELALPTMVWSSRVIDGMDLSGRGCLVATPNQFLVAINATLQPELIIDLKTYQPAASLIRREDASPDDASNSATDAQPNGATASSSSSRLLLLTMIALLSVL